MADWRNRIDGCGEEPPDQLLANPRNFRRHPAHQQAALKGVLAEVGWVQDVLVNRTTGHLVDGHLRVELAMREGAASVPVTYVRLSEAEEALVLATLDPIGALATADREALHDLLAEAETGDAALLALLDDLRRDNGIETVRGGLADPDAVPEPPADPVSKPGDLWLLGGHRVLCGDSTTATDADRLMGGERAEMVWTDPPYGVAVGDKNRWLRSIGRSNRPVEENLVNDTIGELGILQMLRDAFSLAASHCAAGAAWYVAAPPGPLHLRFGEALVDLGVYRQTLIWVKNNATFAPFGVSYHWRHEPILYGWMPNGAHRWHGGRTQDTVWEIARPQASPVHPTMKPVDLVARAVEHSSLPTEVVLDPFLGSGTTLIAAEQLGRRCFGMEIDPTYVDVAVRRWETFTGRAAELDRREDAV